MRGQKLVSSNNVLGMKTNLLSSFYVEDMTIEQVLIPNMKTYILL